MQLQDIDVRFFREDLVRFINSNPLPLEVKRLVMKEVLSEVANTADRVIEQQKQIREVSTQSDVKLPTKEVEKENESEE